MVSAAMKPEPVGLVCSFVLVVPMHSLYAD